MTYFSLVILDESNRMLNESTKQILLSRLGLSCENTHLLEAVIFQRRMLWRGGHESCRFVNIIVCFEVAVMRAGLTGRGVVMREEGGYVR